MNRRSLRGPGAGHPARAVLLLALAAFPAAAGAQEPQAVRSSSADRVSSAVTIYNSNLGLVREVREVQLPAGPAELAFEDVAAQIRSETVHVKAIDGSGPLVVHEQNYRYDVLNPSSLMERYVGRAVTLVSVVPGTGEIRRRQATLLSTASPGGGAGYGYNPGYGGMYVAPPVYVDPWQFVYDVGGEVTFGGGWRILLPAELPPGFVSRPTLFWDIDNPSAGRRRVETSYLTWGMNWKADYVLMLSDDGTRGDLTGWVTLTNDSGIAFEGATLQLVAGEVNVVTPDATIVDQTQRWRNREVLAADEESERGFAEESLFDYHLYTLQRPTDLRDREQKQIELLASPRVPVVRHYRLRGSEYWWTSQQNGIMEALHPSVWLEFVNDEAAGLALPLPAGTVRVYQAEAGRGGGRQFLGESGIQHTAREERVKLEVGRAFDIVADRRQTGYSVLADGLVETEWEIKLRNRKAETVVVELREPTSGDWTVVSSSVPHQKESAREIRFDVTCAPDQEVTVTYKLRVRYY